MPASYLRHVATAECDRDIEMQEYCGVLARTCVASLDRVYLPEAGLFARSTIWDGTGWTKADASTPHTAQVVLALSELRRHAAVTPFDPACLIERLMLEHSAALDYATVGVLLWADSIGDGQHAAQLWDLLRRRFPASASQTAQLGCTLSAVSNYAAVAPVLAPVRRVADELYRRIVANQSAQCGLFYESGTREGWRRSRTSASTLSAQTSSIHALALYGRMFGVADAVSRARRCADAIRRRQGPLGQWWSRYDASSGDVVERYPVLAVHQAAMVPMAFGELQRACGGQDDSAAIGNGLRWLFGLNELGRRLVDEPAKVVWRGIRPCDGSFEIVREMHADHAARCLYALYANDLRP